MSTIYKYTTNINCSIYKCDYCEEKYCVVNIIFKNYVLITMNNDEFKIICRKCHFRQIGQVYFISRHVELPNQYIQQLKEHDPNLFILRPYQRI